MPPEFRPETLRRFAAVAALAVAAMAGACNDNIGIATRNPNADQAYTVYALSGSELSAPNAMSFSTRTVVRVDGAFAFDIAFDINKDGNAVILPVAQVGTPVGGAPLIGLQRSTKAYDELTEAPRRGYVFDSSMVVAPRGTLVMQAQNGLCAAYLASYIFVKITIDSVDVPGRAIFGRTLINSNCGSRQLTPGIPTF